MSYLNHSKRTAVADNVIPRQQRVTKFARPVIYANVVSYLKDNVSEIWAVPATVMFEYLCSYSIQSAVHSIYLHSTNGYRVSWL